MKSLLSYLLVMFAGMFWVFRVIVCLTASLGMDFVVAPFNFTTEIILLFVTILSIVLIAKRNLAGGLLYLVTYGIYFGFSAFGPISRIIDKTSLSSDVMNAGTSLLAILLALMVVIDLLLDRTRTSSRSSGKTSWFYGNKDFDREKDDRADKNNYRIS